MEKVKGSIAAEPVFWPGSIGGRGLGELLVAAMAGGFRKMAISPLLVHQLLTSELTPRQIIDRAAAAQVTLCELDGVSGWAPVWAPKDAPTALQERFAFSDDQCLEMAAALGIRSILTVGAFDSGKVQTPAIIDSFGRFCDKAARYGLYVELEFVPFWGIPDLSAAWEIVQITNRDNAGLLIDTWHLQKGSRNFSQDLALLKALPAGKIRSLQLADARLAPGSDTLYQEGRLRLFPGDGELSIGEIVDAVRTNGDLRYIGAEIFGEAIDGLSSTEAGKKSAESIRTFLE